MDSRGNPQHFAVDTKQALMNTGPVPPYPSHHRQPGHDQGDMWLGALGDHRGRDARPYHDLPCGTQEPQYSHPPPPQFHQFPPPSFPPPGFHGYPPPPPVPNFQVPPPSISAPFGTPQPYASRPDPPEFTRHSGTDHIYDQFYAGPQQSSESASCQAMKYDETVRTSQPDGDREEHGASAFRHGGIRGDAQLRGYPPEDRSSVKDQRASRGYVDPRSSTKPRNPPQTTRRTPPPRSRSPRSSHSRSPRRLRSPAGRGSGSPRRSPTSRRSPARSRSSRRNRSPRRSRSPRDKRTSRGQSERRRSKRSRSRSPSSGGSKGDSRRQGQLPRQQRKPYSPGQGGRQEDRGRDAERPLPRRRSPPINQTQRWDALEAKTAALRDSCNPATLAPGGDQDAKTLGETTTTTTTEDEPAWVQCSPKGNFYSTDPKMQRNDSTVAATDKLKDLLGRFQEEIVDRGARAREVQPKMEVPQPKVHWHVHKDSDAESSDDSASSSSSSEGEQENEDDPLAFLVMKEKHPARLANNLWFNDPGEVNDGPLCRCSTKARQVGIRHNIYPGERPIPLCDPYTNNAGRLHHYRITMAPSTNFLTHQPSVIEYDEREYIFEGFSLFSHCRLDNIPPCKVVRFNIEYSIIFMEEPMPENFSVKGLDLFGDFLFFEILELYDFELVSRVGGCRFFHVLPRFARQLPGNGKEILSMHHVLKHLLATSRPVVGPKDLAGWLACDQMTWERYAEELKGMIVTCPGKKPSSVRVDQVDREHEQSPDGQEAPDDHYPTIVHFGLRPAQLSYAGNRDYQNLFKSYLKMNHLLANKPKVSLQDRQKLAEKEKKLQRIRLQGHMTREVTAEICSKDVLMTGIGSDVCQHAMMLPVLVNHIRYFNCLYNIDDIIGYKFKDRILLKHAMTHPSYRLTYGMNPDHVRNSLYNCGIRQPDYGDKKKQVERSRKKGINTLIKIMSEMAAPEELSSHIHHYERLEFLGDAVVEFVTSTHLYYLFPHLEEGGLATYRQAIVQNQHLAVLAKKMELERFLLYAHGPDLCRSSDLKHALANCLEALMGALYLEGDIAAVRRIFCNLLFDSETLRRIWMQHPKHPLQLEFPRGDRHMIQYSSILQMLHKFEESTGIKFRHIRLLARAFTQRTMSYTNLTRGHNQRMEFLGDTVLQLITSSYLYKHFPNHHEGHLSLLRSSLVNNKTQATVASDLGMSAYIIDAKNRTVEDGGPLPTKLLADLLEAFVGAMYVDQGIEAVAVFCKVCFFPRLKDFIYSQHWNDAKSQLQQCCLTLRTEGKEPDVPQYKVISQHGPTNNRVYNVAVYFRDKRLGTGCASNTQDAQMEAARNALQNYNFPQLHHQRMVVERKYSQEATDRRQGSRSRPRRDKT